MAFLTGSDLWIVLSIAVVAYALVDVARHRGLSTAAAAGWVLLIVLVPLVGPALWFFVGRPRVRPGVRRTGA